MRMRSDLPAMSVNTRTHVLPAGGFLQTNRGNGGGPITPQDERARKATHPAWTMFKVSTSAQQFGAIVSDPTRNLTTDMLWQVYWRTPDVRAAVDSIARRVATTDWGIQAADGAIDSEDQDTIQAAHEEGQRVQRWLRNPMEGRTWQQFCTMWVTDLLVYDAGVVTIVKEGSTLEELVPSRGDDWHPQIDEKGRVGKFAHTVNGKAEEFPTEEVIYVNLFPNTNTPRGMPLIETIINEVISIIRASERTMLTLDASEIPPGVLVLFGIAGKAAEDTIQSFTADKGRDHKIRVLHFPKRGAGDAQWVNMAHSPKELTLTDVIDQVRRSIWRNFGVFPVEMGATDGMPRATAQVQMDASNSHLLVPILELLQEVITSRVLPLIMDEKWLGILEFKFDFTRDLTPQEQQQQSSADKSDVETGILTRNEIRRKRGYKPFGKEGDVATVGTGAQILPLIDALKPKEDPKPEDPNPDDPNPDGGGDGGNGGEDGGGSADDGGPGEGDPKEEGKALPAARIPAERAGGEGGTEPVDRGSVTADLSGGCPTCHSEPGTNIDCRTCLAVAGEQVEGGRARGTNRRAGWGGSPSFAPVVEPTSEAPGETGTGGDARAHVHGPACTHARAWPGGESLEGMNILDLNALDEAVETYQRTVEGLYQTALEEFQVKAREAYADGNLNMGEVGSLTGELNTILSNLSEQWESETAALYLKAAQIGEEGAKSTSGLPDVGIDPEMEANLFQNGAMSYLKGPEGIMEAIRSYMIAIFSEVARSKDTAERQRPTTIPDGVEPGMPEEGFLSAVAAGFQKQKNRITNWAGKLVELGHRVMKEALVTLGVAKVEAEVRTVEWMVEWVTAGGDSCPTCSDLGSRHFIPARDLRTVPGGSTECGGKCRCTLIYHSRADVEAGKAKLIGALNLAPVKD